MAERLKGGKLERWKGRRVKKVEQQTVKVVLYG
jgi:hypothetical protein